MPKIGRKKPSSANDGSVRPMALMALATPSRAGVLVTTTARANAITVPMTTHWTTRLTCW